MTKAFDDMYAEVPLSYKYAHHLGVPILKQLEKSVIRRISNLSRFFIANSRFCASMYTEWGINVYDVIYPPLDCSGFRPTVEKPSENYVLTYFGVFGKETRFSIIQEIANTGVKIKAFGCKAEHIPSYISKARNIQFLGKVSDEELADLYSNALFTLFTFTHEPFGYIPVESMACGTPVLTYNKQGPGESVINESTGWLVDNDEELVKLASTLWNDGYRQTMRQASRSRSLLYDVENISKRWNEVITRSSE